MTEYSLILINLTEQDIEDIIDHIKTCYPHVSICKVTDYTDADEHELYSQTP